MMAIAHHALTRVLRLSMPPCGCRFATVILRPSPIADARARTTVMPAARMNVCCSVKRVVGTRAHREPIRPSFPASCHSAAHARQLRDASRALWQNACCAPPPNPGATVAACDGDPRHEDPQQVDPRRHRRRDACSAPACWSGRRRGAVDSLGRMEIPRRHLHVDAANHRQRDVSRRQHRRLRHEVPHDPRPSQDGGHGLRSRRRRDAGARSRTSST